MPLPFRLVAGLINPKYKIIGNDIAGTVEAVGQNVTQFKRGDEVFGDISRCGFGAFAEYVVARENAVALKPLNLSFEEAASIPTAGCTALQGLRKGNIQSAQNVLVHGAAGGVGTFAVQIAKALGAEVTAVCSSKKLRDDPCDWRRSRARLHTKGLYERRKEVRPRFGGKWRQVDLGL